MSTKKTIIILAGGLGSRYQGLKQIDPILKNGSPILEYSLYDALLAGFSKIVFIINEKIPTSFLERINRIFSDKNVEIHWVYQRLDSNISDTTKLENREKPWGTTHAVLCAKDIVNEPFIVINADDFYGRETYKKASLLIDEGKISEQQSCLLAFPIQHTLSENGAVSRGICTINNLGLLSKIEEKTHIFKKDNGIFFEENHQDFTIPINTLVSMNFWIFHPSIFIHLEKHFNEFLKTYKNQEECYLPSVVQKMIENHETEVLVKASPSEWMGVTYPADKIILKEYIENLIHQKKYPFLLWKPQ
ncbi:MAG: nucleotidyltransferase [Bacteroidetes bacterium]|nr:nucleotidyltransferase [Bacteroidota bacterium]